MAKLPTDRQLKQMIKQAGGVVEAAPKPPKQTDQQKLSRNLTRPGTNKAPEPMSVNRRTLEKLVDRLEQRLDKLVLKHLKGMATFNELLCRQGEVELDDLKHANSDLCFGAMVELNYYLATYRGLDLTRKVS